MLNPIKNFRYITIYEHYIFAFIQIKNNCVVEFNKLVSG